MSHEIMIITYELKKYPHKAAYNSSSGTSLETMINDPEFNKKGTPNKNIGKELAYKMGELGK